MPLVLTENDESLSGHNYDDRTGISYEFPVRYRRLVSPGETFLYYKGRRQPSRQVQRQVYFGCGIVGAVVGPDKVGLMTCEILSYEAFTTPVYFKQTDGNYWESRASSVGNHFRNGVRSIEAAEFIAILKSGLGR